MTARRPWPALLRRAPPLAAALLLAACGGGSSNGSGPPQLRVVDAVWQASTNYDVLVNATSAATDLAYGQADAYGAAVQGANTVVFEPTGTTTTALTASFSAANGSNYTVFALAGNAALGSLIVAQDNGSVPSGQARLSFVHADSAQAALDFYVSAPGADLPASPTLSGLAYAGGSTSGSAIAPVVVTLAAGELRLRAVASGDSTRTVVYDSGTLSVAAGADLLLTVLQASGSAAPFTLLSLGADGSLYFLGDQRVQLRLGNFAPGLAALDGYLDPSGEGNLAANLLDSGIPAMAAAPYQSVQPGAWRASLALAGQTVEQVGAALALAPGTARSVFAVDVTGPGAPQNLQLLSFLDDLSAPPTGLSRLRVLHLSPDLGPVDVVVLDLSGQVPVITQTLVAGLTYGGASAYLDLAPASPAVAVVPSGATQPLLPAGGVPIQLSSGTVSTLVIGGCRNAGSLSCGSTALQLDQLAD
jgi:hypothetical protein